MVTRSKTKIAHTASDLADWVKRPERDVRPVLEKLSTGEAGRILRPIAPAGESEATRYELFHDVLAEPILEWSRVYEQERARRATRRRYARIGAALLTLLVLFAGLAAWALRERNAAREERARAESRALAATANAELAVHPVRSLSLAVQAMDQAHTQEAETVLRRALLVPHGSILGSVQPGKISFNRDGSHILAFGYEGTASISRATAPGNIFELPLRRLVDGDFSPDGTRLLTITRDGSADVWSGPTFERSQTIRAHDSSLDGVAFVDRAGTRFITVGSDDRTGKPNITHAKLWDARTGTLLSTFGRVNSRSVGGALVAPYKEMVAFGTHSGNVEIWVPNRKEPVAVLQHRSRRSSGTVRPLAFSPDGRLLAVARFDGGVQVWNTKTWEAAYRLPGGQIAEPVIEFTGDSSLLLTNSGTTAVVREAASGKKLTVLEGHAGGITGADFSSDSSLVVTSATDGTARVWDEANGEEVAVLRGHGGLVVAAAFSPDSSLIATVGADKTLRTWPINLVVLGPGDGAIETTKFSDRRRACPLGQSGVRTCPRHGKWRSTFD